MTNLNIAFTDGINCPVWTVESKGPQERRRLPFHILPIAGAVLLAHLCLLTLLAAQTSHREITLANSSPPSSVRISMISPPAPPEPPAAIISELTPQVMTSETAQHLVAQEKPKIIEQPKSRPKPAPKPAAKPAPTLPLVEAPPRPPTPAPARPQTLPADSNNAPLLDLPSAGAKDVQTIGCRVPAPSYPRQARRQRIEGNVLVRLQINAQGQVQSAVVARSSGNQELDEAARATVMSASCAPYMENGHAISVRAVQPVNFSLNR
ncbi:MULTISPECIES: energy transducer TonB [Pseudomonas]|jgi:protein TonB|uniref:Protein TonB n=1 Tax=Pseudomonas rhodesiae TaxID=76760 RepID=A0A8I1E8F3_9PSED|nr:MULTISPECIES: energy transducer TonB [Pseudomonas]MBI6599471.1 energy transducer TonB [Pseudomonas sp. S4_EA_1b]MBI6626684.1 energy transducer TonB [Pseudomonas rhodesiae]